MNIMAVRFGKLYKGTPAEWALEDAVAALGLPYRTNFPGYLYGLRSFPDFFLPTLGLVMEVDDDSHRGKVAEDAARTEALENAWGVRVVRCTNEEALANPTETVRRMLSEVGMWPLPKRLPPLATSLPKPKKAPQAQRRAAKSAALQIKRGLA